jgi:hypothetical protein
MPISKRRKVKEEKAKPHTNHSSHSSQTPTALEPKFCYKIAKMLGSILRKTLDKIWKWVTLVVMFAAAALFFLPRVTVEPSGPFDPSHPTSLIFTIANINIIPLRNVQPSVGICFIDLGDKLPKLRGPEAGSGDAPNDCNGPTRSKIAIGNWFVRWLDVDEKYEIPIESGIRTDGPIQNANITIAVTYTPWWMPPFWRNTKEFRFVTKRLSDGKTYWTHVPLNR